MSSSDNNGLPHSLGSGFPLPSEDDLPHSGQGESMFTSSKIVGNRCHASSTLPPPPPVTLPKSCFLQAEKY